MAEAAPTTLQPRRHASVGKSGKRSVCPRFWFEGQGLLRGGRALLRRAASFLGGEAAAQLVFQAFDEIRGSEGAAGVGALADGVGLGGDFGLSEVLAPIAWAPDFLEWRHVQPGCGRGEPGVRGRGGPEVVGGELGDAGSDRVQLGVAEGGPEMRRVQGAGVIAALPEVAEEARRALK